MNNLIRVEDAKLYLAKNYIGGKKSLGQCLDEVPTVNAVVIPDNATNGDMVKALYPNLECEMLNNTVLTDMDNGAWFSLEWWNAPYKKGEASE